jgi:hypothetical protein
MSHDKKLRKEVIRLLFVESQSTKQVLTQTCMGVFLFVTCMIQFLQCFSFLNRRGPPVVRRCQFDKPCYKRISFCIPTHSSCEPFSYFALNAEIYKRLHALIVSLCPNVSVLLKNFQIPISFVFCSFIYLYTIHLVLVLSKVFWLEIPTRLKMLEVI